MHPVFPETYRRGVGSTWQRGAVRAEEAEEAEAFPGHKMFVCLFCFVETGSHVAQAGLKFAVYRRMT